MADADDNVASANGDDDGGRADLTDRARRAELRRRDAQHDAQIYADTAASEDETEAYSAWAARNAADTLSALE